MIKQIRKESNKSIKLTKLALNKQANLIQLISGTQECWSWSTTAGCHGGMRDLVANFIIQNIYRIFRISTVIDFKNIILMKNVCNHHLNADIFLELYLGFITGSFCASLKWVTDISSRSRIVYSTATVFIGIVCTYRPSHKSWAFCSVLESFSWQLLPSSLCLLYSLPPKWVRCICFGIICLAVILLTDI